MRRNQWSVKRVNAETSHDIKLELDVRCQRLIDRTLRGAFPESSLLGEEGVSGTPGSEYRWVVDPIDGTVNFAYGIPHASVSIALQMRTEEVGARNKGAAAEPYQTVLGVVCDPFTDELWSAIRGQAARLNGRVIHASRRRKLADCVVSIGFAKSRTSLERALPYFIWLARRVRKIRPHWD